MILLFSDIRGMDFEPFFARVKGLIFETGSPLDHIGIIAREKNKPAIFGVKGALLTFKSGTPIVVDGDKELVFRR